MSYETARTRLELRQGIIQVVNTAAKFPYRDPIRGDVLVFRRLPVWYCRPSAIA
jgi:hypothetical protein